MDMGLFTNLKFDSLDDLLQEQLRDLYDAEHRLTEALPKMVDAAHNPELKQVFDQHLTETRGQVRRLEQVFSLLGWEPERSTCDAMKGLISEGDAVLSAKGDADVLDAALIAAAQRVEHYEIAGYGTVRTLAQRLGHVQAAELLQETLDEEGNADKILTEVAEQSVNVQAARA
jgi:ferritin-like metal-binding protein YciE